MSKEQVKEYFSDALLTTGAGSWGIYAMFKSISDFCRDLLPITGVISFIVYIILNWSKIKTAIKPLFNSKQKRNASKSTKKDSNS